MPIIGGVIAAALFVVLMVAILAYEDHDKRTRAENGLPPKKYHDITDQDVTIVYSVRHKKD